MEKGKKQKAVEVLDQLENEMSERACIIATLYLSSKPKQNHDWQYILGVADFINDLINADEIQVGDNFGN